MVAFYVFAACCAIFLSCYGLYATVSGVRAVRQYGWKCGDSELVLCGGMATVIFGVPGLIGLLSVLM